jgi:hypothetical protein
MTDHNRITDDRLRQIALEVEREYGMGGLSGGTIYEDFALDVAKRAMALVAEDCARVAYGKVAEGRAHEAHVAIRARYGAKGE